MREHRHAPSSYIDKVLGIEPANLLAYWPLNEPSGSVAHDRSGHGRHGAYTGVTLGSAGIGDGNHCPFFDGINDFVNIYSVSLRDAFNGAEGTVAIWVKVYNAGVWTDGTARMLLSFHVNNENRFYLWKLNVPDDDIQIFYAAGGTPEVLAVSGMTDTTWMHWAMTWSKSAGATGELLVFQNGAQEGATQTGLGTWAGVLAPTGMVIGEYLASSHDYPWHGYFAHPAVWDIPLTPAQIAQLAVV